MHELVYSVVLDSGMETDQCMRRGATRSCSVRDAPGSTVLRVLSEKSVPTSEICVCLWISRISAAREAKGRSSYLHDSRALEFTNHAQGEGLMSGMHSRFLLQQEFAD